jgi:beta-glucosidase
MKAARFLARFAETAAGALGDLVRVWMTVNEPTMWAVGAYLTREYPPYRRSLRLFLRCLEVFAAAHVALYQGLNEVHARNSWPRPTIGFAYATHGIDSYNRRSPLDRLAAGLMRRILEERFLERVLGKGPTIDALGLNYYLCLLARFPLAYRMRTDLPQSMEGWPVDPFGFRRVLCDAWAKYPLPIWVLENGVGEEDDALRPRFLLDHLYQMHRAIEDGADVRAYHHWAAMDTLEYHKGYAIRYGLIKVDFESEDKSRSLRVSGRMYGEIASANGITEEIVRKYVPEWSPDAFPVSFPRLYGSGGRRLAQPL